MKTSPTRILVLLNAAVAVLYLIGASRWWWMQPELADIPGASGGSPYVWFLASLYTLVFVVLLNISFFSFHCYFYLKRKERKLDLAVLLIPVLWAIAVYIDFSHH